MNNEIKKPNSADTILFDDVSFSYRDIFSVVETFYIKVQTHPTLSIPFSSVGDWPYHIQRITNFWWIKLGGKPYMLSQYNPIPKHFYAGFSESLLSDWLSLFREVLESKLDPEQVKVWSDMSLRIGKHLTKTNERFRLKVEESSN